MYMYRPRLSLFVILLALFIVCVVTTRSGAQTLPTVAVKPFTAQGVSEHEVATLSEVLRTELMNMDSFEVMERSQMDEILKEQAFQQSGACNEKECLVQMGQMLGIEQIIAGTIGKVGHAYSITARIISVESGKIISSVSHNYTGPIEDLLTQEMKIVAKKLTGEKTSFKERNFQNRSGALLFTGIGVGTLAVAGGITYLIVQNSDSENNDNAEVEVLW